jgi:hypothetical protein
LLFMVGLVSIKTSYRRRIAQSFVSHRFSVSRLIRLISPVPLSLSTQIEGPIPAQHRQRHQTLVPCASILPLSLKHFPKDGLG